MYIYIYIYLSWDAYINVWGRIYINGYVYKRKQLVDYMCMYVNYGCIWYTYVSTYVDNYAGGCNWVFAFETRALHLRPDMLPLGHATFTTKANRVVLGTSAKFAFQRIGHIGHSLGLGRVPVSSLVPSCKFILSFKFIHSFPHSNSLTHSNSFNRSMTDCMTDCMGLPHSNSLIHSTPTLARRPAKPKAHVLLEASRGRSCMMVPVGPGGRLHGPSRGW